MGASISSNDHEHTEGDHGDAEELAHGDPLKDESYMAVGFTEKLDKKSGDAIADDEGPKYRSRWCCPPVHDCE